MKLTGKTAIVTGRGTGIGESVSLTLAAHAVWPEVGWGAQRRFPGYAQERAPEGDPQGDAPCPRNRNVPIRLYWFMASG
jgi:NAD(P)-dependent dehydrogenase (short-subunit alcohol dehydrogenase family)